MMKRMLEAGDRLFGIPRWAWLPLQIGLLDLFVAAFGFYWDVAWHIEKGRDKFLFTPPHVLILIGLGGVGATGALAYRLYRDAGGSDGFRIRGRVIAPGAALLLASGLFAISGFPLDDLWHLMFGEDVTLWSPTHLLMVTGAAISPLAFGVLLAHGRSAAAGEPGRGFRVLGVATAAAMLVGLTAYQAEFDFGVPQFQLLYQPVLIAVSAALVLVAARWALGRGAAIATAVTYIAIRGLVDVGLVAVGREIATFPLYVAAAAVIEIVAWRRRPKTLAAAIAIGVGIGVVAVPVEAALAALWERHGWNAHTILLGVLVGGAGAVAAAVISQAIASTMRPAIRRVTGTVVAVAGAVVVGAILFPLPRQVGPSLTATVTVTPASAASSASDSRATSGRLNVDLHPADAADGAEWFEVMGWQGGGHVIAPLREVAPGRYTTDRAVPLGGSWKILVRVAKGTQLAAVPVWMPSDPEIGKVSIPAKAATTRRFQLDSALLMREAHGGPWWATVLGWGAVGAVAITWVVLFVIGLTRQRSILAARPLLSRERTAVAA